VTLGGVYSTKAIVSGSATDSTSTITGGLILAGGAGIAKTLTTGASRIIKALVTATGITLDATHHLISTTNGVPITLTLPASPITGQTYMVKSKGAGQVTIAAAAGNTLFTNAAVTTFVLNTGDATIVTYDGATWVVM